MSSLKRMSKSTLLKMKSLVKLLDGFKINDPKVFMLVTLIANIVIGVLDYYGTYGSEEIKPLIVTVTSIVTVILTYLGVRTTRFLQNNPEPITETTELIKDIHIDTVIADNLNTKDNGFTLEESKSFDSNIKNLKQ